MYFHVLLGISIISFCFGEDSNMAKSAVSFHRDDGSLSYSYSYNNIHPLSHKSHVDKTRSKHKKIQYAPLVSHHDTNKNDEKHAKAVVNQKSDLKNLTKSEYLEPQAYGSAKSHGNRQFVSGYNIDVPKLSNVAYKTVNSEYKNIANEKTIVNNFQKNTDDIPPKKQDLSQDHINNLMLINSNNNIHQNQQNQFTQSTLYTQILPMLENPQIHPAFNPFVKNPQLHLNVARAFNFAHNPIQAPTKDRKKWQQNYGHGQGNRNDKQALLKHILYPMNY